MEVEKITAKWKQFGFLDQFDDIHKDKVALCFESMANILLNGTFNKDIETLAFPIMYRVFKQHCDSGTIDSFNPSDERIYEIITFINGYYTKLEPIFAKHLSFIDYQAEICAEASNLIFRNENLILNNK